VLVFVGDNYVGIEKN